MKKKLRVSFIYHKENIFLSGNHFDNTYYHFFMKALNRNQKIDVKYFPTNDVFDSKILKNDTDLILLWSNANFGMPKEILGIDELDIPVISRGSDPGDAKKAKKNHSRWKIDHYFHFLPEELFHELYPSNFKYKKIFYGLESSLYQTTTDFANREKNKILNSGNVGNTKIISRIINDIRNPKWNNYRCKILRTKCNELSFVDYTSTLNHEFVNDQYPLLLQKYCSAIAADTNCPVQKYWEIPAAGCLTFMEVTKKNRGEHIGFVDDESAIFINEKNYVDKFEEFLGNPDDPKWQKIAYNGRKHALKNFNNDNAVESLIDLMNKLI
jgi:hypothetical protein